MFNQKIDLKRKRKMNNHEFANLNGMTRYCKEAEDKFKEYLEGIRGNEGNYFENARGYFIIAIEAIKQINEISENRLEQLTQTQLDKTNEEKI